jgi:hypothetical protein
MNSSVNHAQGVTHKTEAVGVNQGLTILQDEVRELTAQLLYLNAEVESYKEQCALLRSECQILQGKQLPACKCRAILDFAFHIQARSKLRTTFFRWMWVVDETRRSEQDKETMSFVRSKLYDTGLAMAFERFCGAVAHLKAQGNMAKGMGFWMRKRAMSRILRDWSQNAVRQQLLHTAEQLANVQSSQLFSARREEIPCFERLISSLQVFGKQWLMLDVARTTRIARISAANRVGTLMKRSLLDFWFRLFVAGLVTNGLENVRVQQFVSRRAARQCRSAFRKLSERTETLRKRRQKFGNKLLSQQSDVMWQHLNAWNGALRAKDLRATRVQDCAVQTWDSDQTSASQIVEESQKKMLAMLLTASFRRRMHDSAIGENPVEEPPAGNDKAYKETSSPCSWDGDDRLDVSQISADSTDSKSSDHIRDLRSALQSATQCLDKKVSWTLEDDGRASRQAIAVALREAMQVEQEDLSASITSALGKIDSLCQDLDVDLRGAREQGHALAGRWLDSGDVDK